MTYTAVVFPGQGVQAVGMGKDFYDHFDHAKEIFDRADDILGRKISTLIFDGDINELTRTSNAQLAIFITCTAIFNAVFDMSKLPSMLDAFRVSAGHSLGEYTALHISGYLSFEDTLKIVEVRGKAIEESIRDSAHYGMYAILGIDAKQAQKIIQQISCDGVCDIANDNSDDQIVISGHMETLNAFIEIAKAYSMKKAIPLNVSGPFHSRLMIQAGDIVEDFIRQIKVLPGKIPVVMNCDAQSIYYNVGDLKFAAVKQIFSTVRWRETMQVLHQDYDIKKILEIGPGRVLTNLARKNYPDIDVYNISNIKDLENLHSFVPQGCTRF